jgi:ankyrin repeat protein
LAKQLPKNNNGETPLHLMGEFGNEDLVALLLAHGAEVNAKSKKGYSPLRVALIQGHKDIVELLRRHGGHE